MMPLDDEDAERLMARFSSPLDALDAGVTRPPRRHHHWCLFCDGLGWYPYWPFSTILRWHLNREASRGD